MKNLMLLTFTAFLSISGSVYAAEENACSATLAEHIELIDSTESYIAQIGDKSHQISPFEVIQLQRKLTQRFLSLKHLFSMYDDESLNCPTKIMPTVVALYDFDKVGQSIFANKTLRRVVMGFVKYPNYQLTDYKAYYDRYTNKKLIAYINEKIENNDELTSEEKAMSSSAHGGPKTYSAADIGAKGTSSIVAGGARVWGFISDHLKWREGRLKDNAEAKELLLSNLKPLDLVYEKRTFVLSNYTIPGHWGHVGIWLGTKEELIELGVWDKDYFAPFRAQVEAGNHIVEVRKQGVNFQSLDSFINLDEIAVTRVKNITDNAGEVFAGLSDQFGKKYDFQFNAQTADKITCAEFIAFAYGDIPWHQTKTINQMSLRPDDMALTTLDENPSSEFVLFLKGNKDKTTFKNLGSEDWAALFAKK